MLLCCAATYVALRLRESQNHWSYATILALVLGLLLVTKLQYFLVAVAASAPVVFTFLVEPARQLHRVARVLAIVTPALILASVQLWIAGGRRPTAVAERVPHMGVSLRHCTQPPTAVSAA